jgi:hypothetical protein
MHIASNTIPPLAGQRSDAKSRVTSLYRTTEAVRRSAYATPLAETPAENPNGLASNGTWTFGLAETTYLIIQPDKVERNLNNLIKGW